MRISKKESKKYINHQCCCSNNVWKHAYRKGTTGYLYPLLIGTFMLAVYLHIRMILETNHVSHLNLQERDLLQRYHSTSASYDWFSTFTNPFHATTFNDNQSQHHQRALKRNIYLHVGPGKMATTTLQNSLKNDATLLAQDGYCTHNMHPLGKILGEGNAAKIEKHADWTSFLNKLDECYSTNQHVLLSSEFMGLIDPRIFQDFLQPAFERWNLIIVVGYRRYYEWLPSVYFQLHRAKEEIPGVQDFVRKDGRPFELYTENYLIHWRLLVQGQERADESKVNENDIAGSQGLRRRDKSGSKIDKYSGVIIDDSESANDNIRKTDEFDFLIYNMHENRNVLKTIYCRVLPSTDKACQQYSNILPPKDNAGFPIDYDRLVIAASSRNKLHGIKGKSISIEGKTAKEAHEIARELQELWEIDWGHSIMNFPRDCLEESELQELFDKSMELEALLVPDFYEDDVVPHLDQLYEDFRESATTKLCSVNVEKVIHDEEYQTLWNGLERKRNEKVLAAVRGEYGFEWSRSH